jgi:hypothetical protein
MTTDHITGPSNISRGCKIFQMAIFQGPRKIPKVYLILGLEICTYTIWQPWCKLRFNFADQADDEEDDDGDPFVAHQAANDTWTNNRAKLYHFVSICYSFILCFLTSRV